MRFRFVSSSYWEVTDKTGTKYLFGQSAASRQDGTPGTFKWMLDTVTDTHTNTVIYTYSKDQGEIYIDHIDYQATHIQFYRESRSDVSTLYTPNFGVTTSFRLKTINITANGVQMRVYKVTYTQGVRTSRSLLANVQQFDNSATVNNTSASRHVARAGSGPGPSIFLAAHDWPPQSDLFFSAEHVKRYAQVVTLGQTVVKSLLPDGANPLAGMFSLATPLFWSSA